MTDTPQAEPPPPPPWYTQVIDGATTFFESIWHSPAAAKEAAAEENNVPLRTRVSKGVTTVFGSIWRSRVFRSSLVLSVIGAGVVFAGRSGLVLASKLEVMPIKDADPTPDGIVYFLPKSVIIVEATFQIVRCDVSQGANGEMPTVNVDATVSAVIYPEIMPDFQHEYAIKGLSGGFWNTDFRLDLNHSMLSRLGTKDSSTIGTPVRLPPVRTTPSEAETPGSEAETPGTSAPPPASPGETKLRRDVCGRTVLDALARKDRSEQGGLKLRRLFRIEPGAGIPCSADTEMAVNEVLKDPSRIVCRIPGEQTVGTLIESPGRIAKQLERYTLSLQIRSMNKAPTHSPSTNNDLVYRLPGSALVSVCMTSCDGGVGARIISETEIIVPQFGTEASVPIERRLFSNRSLQLEFGWFGELTSVRFVDTESEGNKAADTSKLPNATNEESH
jgi:hypothetical protein